MKRSHVMFQRGPHVIDTSYVVHPFHQTICSTPLWSHILAVVSRHLQERGYSWTSTFGTYTTTALGCTTFVPSDIPLLYLTLIEMEWLISDLEAILARKTIDDYSPWLLTSEEYERIIFNGEVNEYIKQLHEQQERY